MISKANVVMGIILIIFISWMLVSGIPLRIWLLSLAVVMTVAVIIGIVRHMRNEN